jgi:SAM-dependent methyltransferase
VDKRSQDIEAEQQAKYRGAVYQPETISVRPSAQPTEYSPRMLALKLDLIREYCQGDSLLDVGCSTGLQLASLAPGRRLAVGVDFSFPFLAHASKAPHGDSIRLVCGNARALPLATGSVAGAYSLASLYTIPDVGEVIAEIGRVLRPGGRCVLDMGNENSLNNIVVRAYPELAAPCHVPVASMIRMIRDSGMRVLVHRVFQILPMWGDRPARLKWLMAPAVIKFMTREVGGRMIDEWVSSLPILRRYAFRHVIVCERT